MIAVVFILIAIGIVLLCYCFIKNAYFQECCKEVCYLRNQMNKFHHLYSTLFNWMISESNNKSICDLIKSKGWKKIAIYGCGDLGRLLCDKIKNDLDVRYGIDKQQIEDFPVKVIKPEDCNQEEEVDVIIVTAIMYFYEIEEYLGKSIKADIVSFEDLVLENVY